MPKQWLSGSGGDGLRMRANSHGLCMCVPGGTTWIQGGRGLGGRKGDAASAQPRVGTRCPTIPPFLFLSQQGSPSLRRPSSPGERREVLPISQVQGLLRSRSPGGPLRVRLGLTASPHRMLGHPKEAGIGASCQPQLAVAWP